MAGDIGTAYVGIAPSMSGFGTQLARQLGPDMRRVGAQLGNQFGAATAARATPHIRRVSEEVSVAARESRSWLDHTAQMALKNTVLYGSMYVAIRSAQLGIKSMFEDMVGFNAQLEQATIAFTTLLGSADRAQQQLTWIKDFARETPFNLGDLIGYSQQLLALGFNAEQARDVLRATGDAAAALGRGSESIARINLALGQMWTKGKVQSQEMLQLTEAGIAAWEILAEAYGVSVAEVQDAVSKGLVAASDAVPALIEGMNARFAGMMERQSRTYAGIVSNIQDTLEQRFAEAGEPLFRELTIQAQRFLDALDDPEVLDMMRDFGQFVAVAARNLADLGRFAWEFRDALLMVGGAMLASRMLQRVPVGAFFHIGTLRQVSDGLVNVGAAQRAMQQANLAALNTSIRLGVAERELAAARAAVAAADERVANATTRNRAATQALLAARQQLVVAEREHLALTARSIAADNAAAAATQRATAALEARAAVMARLRPALQSVGQIAGFAVAIDGLRRVSEAGTDASAVLAGIGMTMVGGAAAGAAFGGAIGAAAGAVAGAVAGVWSYVSAVQAANNDTSALVNTLQQLGVEGTLAQIAFEGLTNQQIAMLGGADALVKALRAGRLDEFIEQSKEFAAVADAKVAKVMDLLAEKMGLLGPLVVDQAEAFGKLVGIYSTGEDSVKALLEHYELLDLAQEQVTLSSYQAAVAADMQRGKLEEYSAAAWQALIASGELSAQTLGAALRLEAMAGIAGYATEMLLGIPANTPINFTSNAAVILDQIIALRAAAEAGFSNMEQGRMTADAYERRLRQLQQQYRSAIQGTSIRPSLPQTGGGGRGGGAVRSAVDDAARKLEQDRAAQLRFADAFTSLMEAALEGNFEQFRDRLEDQIVSLTRDGYTKAANKLRELSGVVTQASLDYAALTNKLHAAEDAYKDLLRAQQQQYEATRDQILGLGEASQAQSFDQLLYLLGETTNRTVEYQSVLEQLRELGLSDELWKQLAQAGPESLGLAQSILAQGESGIAQLNALSDQLVDAADSMGSLVSDAMYEQGAQAMQAYIEGLKSGQSALIAQLEQIANNILSQVAPLITPGNAGWSPISTAPQQAPNTFNVEMNVDLSNIDDVQRLIELLNSLPNAILVNQAGQVVA